MKRLKKTDLTTRLIEALLDIALLAGLCRLDLRSFFQQFQHPCSVPGADKWKTVKEPAALEHTD
jgi:hypothetical protein